MPDDESRAPSGPPARLRLRISGAVQGVGFRPFVYRLARELGLRGSVRNDPGGLVVDVEGSRPLLERLPDRIRRGKPPVARITRIEATWGEPSGAADLRIEASREGGRKRALVLPDLATCDDCLAEVLDPAERRHGYPFTNCTACGPRLSILDALPYDRPNTTMRTFILCPACRREYEDPGDRRFHAQPVACADCGPRLELLDGGGETLATGAEALDRGATVVEEGGILALKGLGGYQLLVDARSPGAVTRLRRRKGRPHKPLALMVPDLGAAGRVCELPLAAATELACPAAPIVVLPGRADAGLAHEELAPGSGELGIMLPYTPLHHLLLRRLGFPVVATSGNRSGEPIVTDDAEAGERLADVAAAFLAHDRPVRRQVDDSVGRMIAGEVRLLRRARGYAPLPVARVDDAETILAVGGQLKNAVAVVVDGEVIASQHVGDMHAPLTREVFERTVADFLDLYDLSPTVIAHDLHPDYATTHWARDAARPVAPAAGERKAARRAAGETSRRLVGARLEAIHHHHAHLASCLADNDHAGPALGVTWDGTGHGTDDTIWGGEFLIGGPGGYRRLARLRPLRLPGGEQAIRQPWRVGIALLWGVLGEAALEDPLARSFSGPASVAPSTLARMLSAGVGSPFTSSAGRLFDGVAALAGLHREVSFEGQAAMALEQVADTRVREAYPMTVGAAPETAPGEAPRLEVDWRPLVEEVRRDCGRGVPAPIIAAKFHNALVDVIVTVAEAGDEPVVALTGGCFQNRLLTERAREGLRSAGFEVLLHRQVPANDGGLAVGQAVIAAARSRARDDEV